MRPLYEASVNKFGVDQLYGWVVVGPTRGFAVVCDFLDTYLVDRLVLGVAQVPRLVGRRFLARYQNGLIQQYASASALSIVFLLFVLLLMSVLT